ncbi:hypothetical protein Tco_1363088 [Tanacetum coccineum]
MKENESVDSFTTKLTSIVNKAVSLGLTYEDSVVMSVDEAIGRLKTFEERLKSKKEIPVDSQESLMFTRHEAKENLLENVIGEDLTSLRPRTRQEQLSI